MIDVLTIERRLRDRGHDPRVVDERDLAIVLPQDTHVPPWARFGPRTWPAAGYDLLFRLYDYQGELRSVLARRLGPGDGPKSTAPRGYERRGLVMADALGLHLLRTGSRPAGWTPDAPPLRVVIAEGEMSWLAFACEASDADEHAPATLGIVSGSWTEELAARIPAGSHVIIATDWDATGHKYAEQIASTLGGRDLSLFRWRADA